MEVFIGSEVVAVALVCQRSDLPRRNSAQETPTTTRRQASDGYTTLLGLISHEYFHTWNVKRLRPADLTTYDYTRENYTELLWFFEGFTSYYDDLFLVRTGLIDQTRYLRQVQGRYQPRCLSQLRSKIQRPLWSQRPHLRWYLRLSWPPR